MVHIIKIYEITIYAYPRLDVNLKKNNSKYQMHFRLRELASPSNPPLYPNIDISDDIIKKVYLACIIPIFILI